MKSFKILKNIALIFALTIPVATIAQDTQIFPEANSNGKELKVNIKPYAGKVYINWKEKDHSLESYYFIQKSTDGENFFIVGLKESYKLANAIELQYSFVEDQIDSVNFYYRVIRVAKYGNEMLASSSPEFIIVDDNKDQHTIEVTPNYQTAFKKQK